MTAQLIAFLTHKESTEAIRQAMGDTPHAIELGDASTAATYLASHPSPATIIVEVPSAEHAPAMLDALADVVRPGTRVIVTGVVDSYRFYDWLLKLGIHDYLLQPFTPAQLTESLKKASGTPKPEPVAGSKKTIAAIGARGGVGTTTFITTLASCLARNHGIPTALADLDPHYGSMALALDLEAGRGMRDIWEKPERIDSIYLDRTMVKPFSPLSMLSAEEAIGDIITPQPVAGERLFAALRESAELIAVDVPRQVTSLTRYALTHADHVFIVTEPTVLCLRDILRIRDFLVDGVKRPAPLLVINREGLQPKSQLSHAAITKHVGLEIALTLGFNEEIADTVARGEPLLDNPKLKKLLEPVCHLADGLMGITKVPAESTSKPKRSLSSLFGEK